MFLLWLIFECSFSTYYWDKHLSAWRMPEHNGQITRFERTLGSREVSEGACNDHHHHHHEFWNKVRRKVYFFHSISTQSSITGHWPPTSVVTTIGPALPASSGDPRTFIPWIGYGNLIIRVFKSIYWFFLYCACGFSPGPSSLFAYFRFFKYWIFYFCGLPKIHNM